jgi:phosphopantetheinyl transferase
MLLEYLNDTYRYTGRLEKDATGKPIPISINGKKLYWSLSHSKNLVGFIVDSLPVALDIVDIEERDSILLDTHQQHEYEKLGDRDWKNFYILWSAKEALIKAIGKYLEDMRGISLIEKKTQNSLIFDFLGQKYRIEVVNEDKHIVSIFSSSPYELSI